MCARRDPSVMTNRQVIATRLADLSAISDRKMARPLS
ncbi:hypothetical protein SPH9361_02872 [Sphingobium sp. CECT 9361]|nr:hypothetical protein SPH9361_02872 [Sphingobium sp. CECT 9361]